MPKETFHEENRIHENSVSAIEILTDREIEFFLFTSIPWEKLKSQLSDRESYEELSEAVAEATEKNENIAQFKVRLESLGVNVMNVAKKVFFLLE